MKIDLKYPSWDHPHLLVSIDASKVRVVINDMYDGPMLSEVLEFVLKQMQDTQRGEGKPVPDICAKWAEAARIGTLYAGESVILSSLIAAALREERERAIELCARVADENAATRARLAKNSINGGRVSRVALHEEAERDSYLIAEEIRFLKDKRE